MFCHLSKTKTDLAMQILQMRQWPECQSYTEDVFLLMAYITWTAHGSWWNRWVRLWTSRSWTQWSGVSREVWCMTDSVIRTSGWRTAHNHRRSWVTSLLLFRLRNLIFTFRADVMIIISITRLKLITDLVFTIRPVIKHYKMMTCM